MLHDSFMDSIEMDGHGVLVFVDPSFSNAKIDIPIVFLKRRALIIFDSCRSVVDMRVTANRKSTKPRNFHSKCRFVVLAWMSSGEEAKKMLCAIPCRLNIMISPL